MKENTRNRLYAVLVVLLFLAGSVGTIAYLYGKQPKALANETALFNASLPEGVSLTERQQDIINNSVKILSNEVESEGVTVKLRAAYGNALTLHFYIDVILPEWMDEEAVNLEKHNLFIQNGQWSGMAFSRAQRASIEGDPNDHTVSFVYTLTRGLFDAKADGKPGGLYATLRLEDLSYPVGEVEREDEEGLTSARKMETLYGNWSFDLYIDKAIYGLELAPEPLIVEGISYDVWDSFQTFWYSMQVDSFYLHEQGVSMRYQINKIQKINDSSDTSGGNKDRSNIAFRMLLVYRDGSSLQMKGTDRGEGLVFFESAGPIPLDQVSFVVLNDYLVIPVS